MSDAPILTEIADGIAVLTINRPKVLNALDIPTLLALEKTVAALEAELGTPAAVEVTSDAKHGTLARVRLAGPTDAEAVARSVLDRYAVRYEISREETTT